ncbi:MAG: type I secretion system permease/ATPase [bacterium]
MAEAGHKPELAIGRIFRRSRKFVLSVGLFSMFINLLMLVPALYMLQIYDRVLSSGSVATLLYLTLVAGGLILTAALLELFRSRILVRLSGHMDRELRGPMFSGLLNFGLQHKGAGLAQPLRDLDTLRTFLSGNGLIFFFDAPWAVIFILVIFMMHWVLGVLALAGALILLALAFVTEKLTQKTLAEANQQHMSSYNFAESSFRNADAIGAMGMMPGLRSRWQGQHDRALALQAVASDRAGGVSASVKFVRPFLQVLMLGTGGFLVLQQAITPGMMIAASIILGRALAPVEGALGHWRGIGAARGAYSRLKAFVAALPEEREHLRLPEPRGALRVEGVVAMPPGTRTPVLGGVSFALQPGDSLGIVGPSAAGKSSLARLLVGVWRPSAGKVRLDGADVADWPNEELGPHLGYLPQDVELFEGTIAENIARFQQPDSEAVVRAARQAGVHDMILRLERGYDTQIGPGGASLSGGQRQRIGLARALYGEPKLVVLDEPNSNLDSDGEMALWKALAGLRERKATVVMIAHRNSMLSHVSKLLVLNHGRVEAFGPKDQVIPKLTGSTAKAAGRRLEAVPPVAVRKGAGSSA